MKIYTPKGQEVACDSDQIPILIKAGWSLTDPSLPAPIKSEKLDQPKVRPVEKPQPQPQPKLQPKLQPKSQFSRRQTK